MLAGHAFNQVYLRTGPYHSTIVHTSIATVQLINNWSNAAGLLLPALSASPTEDPSIMSEDGFFFGFRVYLLATVLPDIHW